MDDSPNSVCGVTTHRTSGHAPPGLTLDFWRMMKTDLHIIGSACCFAVLACLSAGCTQADEKAILDATPATGSVRKPQASPVATSHPIVAAARAQVGKTTIYDPAYVGLAYPGGDVPIERGVCTDVIVRALRTSYRVDLQKLLHEDMKNAFSQYPGIWGLKKPDRNIDHRRVPNLKAYFHRKGHSVEVTRNAQDYLPGDFVTCTVGGNRPHIMIVSDKKTSAGVPLVIHNIGNGAREEDRLFDFPITGHYRFKMAG